MSKVKSKMTKRVFAGTMAFLMLLSLLPMPVVTKAEITDAITITVKDENGDAVEGATVEIVIDYTNEGVEDVTETETTDADGMVLVMSNNDFAAKPSEFKISATATKDEYTGVLDLTDVTAENQNFDITIKSSTLPTIDDVTVQGQTLTYNGNAQDAVVVTGTQDGDAVTYSIDGGETLTELPQVTDVGTYSITVTVERTGHESYSKTVDTTVEKAVINGITVTAKADLAYDGEEKELVTVEGEILDTDTVTWKVNGVETRLSEIPKALAVGEYKVQLIVDRDSNYEVYESEEITVTIAPGAFDVEGVTVQGLDSVYTGEEQDSVTVTIEDEANVDYDLFYQITTEAEAQPDEDAWVEEIPTVTNAGSYIVWVKAVKANYDDVEVDVTPAASAIAPFNVYVGKAKQEVKFDEETYQLEASAINIVGVTPFIDKKFDFSATDVTTKGIGTIAYELELGDDASDIASINGAEVTVEYPGVITVIATLSGDDNHHEAVVTHELTVKAVPETDAVGTYVDFAEDEIEYTFGTLQGIVSEQSATKTNVKDTGTITYSIDKTDIGLACDANSGRITITDYEVLGAALLEAGDAGIEVIVTAEKAGTDFYGADSTSYKVVISFAETPTETVEVSGTKGKIDEVDTEWYITAVTVTPKDTVIYSISDSFAIDSFNQSVELNNQGTATQYVYLRDVATGGITNRIAINEKIDTEAPDTASMNIELSDLTLIEMVGNALGFYKPNTTITFTAEDVTSGVHHFNWVYTRENGTSETNHENKNGTLDVTVVDGVATAQLTLPLEEAKDMRGNIAFTAVDNAGNESNAKSENKVFVIDQTNPDCNVTFEGAEAGVNATQGSNGEQYFNGAVKVTFTITEANFYEEIVTVSVEKDSKSLDGNFIEWDHEDGTDEYVGTFTLTEDGDYVVTIDATDKSENSMTQYVSETIVIDSTESVVDFVFDSDNQNATITVTERNFRAENMNVVANAITDIIGADIANKDEILSEIEAYVQDEDNWTTNKNVHTLVLESAGENAILVDAIYDLKFVFTDLAGTEVEKQTGVFVIDHTNPTDVEIEYSATNLIDTILETVTLGFYKPSVDITFVAHDSLSGIDNFEWKYIKQDGASSINRPSDESNQIVDAVQDATDKTKYTATVTVSATEAEQIRGSFVVTAVDNYGNKSVTAEDKDIVIIVDTKNPECEVSFIGTAQTVEDVHYFKEQAVVSFIITEANFYEECVTVTVSKTEGDATTTESVNPTWADGIGEDEHVGTFTITGEGDYIVKIEATDKTENAMTAYVSDTITIDNTDPVIEYEYDVDNQEVVVTVTEHNFRPTDIEIDVEALNIKGEAVSTNNIQVYAQKENNWVNSGDKHTLTLASGENEILKDAIYQWTINYNDLALNNATEVKTENFVVDHTKPVDLAIIYSEKNEKEKLADAILETITLGFYNPTVEITFIAYDYASGIEYFNWGYTQQDDSSEINRETDTAEMIEEQKVLAIQSEADASKYTATIALPEAEAEQLRGYFTIIATDKYGHSEEFTDSDNIIIVDTKAPTCTVKYNDETIDGTQLVEKHYYDADVEVSFTITEANFYEEDVIVSVSKDGTTTTVNPVWSDGATADEHVGKFTLEGDGDYIVTIKATDKADNTMTDYVSETIIIDKIAPVLTFTYDVDNQSATIKVTERNFDATDMEVVVQKAKDVTGEDVIVNDIQDYVQNSANWTTDGNVHSIVLESGEGKLLADGIYVLEINYVDLVDRDAIELVTEEFVVDHSVPSGVKIEYLTNPIEEILEAVTLGIYEPNVQVKFTAYDNFTGVDYFNWSYTKQTGSSDDNRPTDTADIINEQKVEAVQDSEDKTKFTATITIPADEAEQWRGYLSVKATDNYGNVSDIVTDEGRIIIFDTIAPEVTVAYNAADRVVGTDAYYNNDVTATITVTEANFFEEDVVVTVSKNGETAYAVKPTWTNNSADEHVGVFTLSSDGHYVVNVSCEDKSGNRDGEKSTYSSHEITIDKTAPIINVTYNNSKVVNTLKDRDNHTRKYFVDTQTAVVTIEEHNFDADNVNFNIVATDVTGAALNVNNLHSKTDWEVDSTGDVHTMTITYPGDANYTFDISCTDLATNASTDYAADYFTVDKTAPVSLKATYSTSILETVLETISFGFYNAKATVTIVAEDAVSGVHSFAYSYLKASGVSAVNAELINQAIAAAGITYSNGGKTATATFQIPKDVLTSNSQFNGTIAFDAVDRTGWKSTFVDNKRIVVDNIAPTAEVTYNAPVTSEAGISYYSGNVEATIVITEANFYAGDVSVTVSKDGGAAYAVTPSWSNNSVDLHTGTFTLSGDGDYIVTINYQDKSTNKMTVYTSEQLTIDTDIQEPTITFNGNNETGHAYKGEIVPQISFSDINYDSFEVFLYRTYMNEINVDVTAAKNVNNLFTINENSGSAILNIFDIDENGNYNPNDDGIYHLVVTMYDKAGHSIEQDAYFTINRFGSVYAFDEYLVELTANGGSFVNQITEDLIITEYNADKLVSDSLSIEITRDGKPLDEVKYTASPAINENVSVGDSGWYQYEYVISKDNFVTDGIYKISISSKDATGNTPENSNYEDKNITFYVDSTVPEITSITGLEESIVNDTELTVSYTIFDAIALKSIKIYVDGEVYEEITDFSADFNNYEGKFTLEESEASREIRIFVEDKAGNITDTAAEDFSSAYAFNDKVTVTTNALVRFMANKPLFYGSIAGTVGVVVLAGVGIRIRMKKKQGND